MNFPYPFLFESNDSLQQATQDQAHIRILTRWKKQLAFLREMLKLSPP